MLLRTRWLTASRVVMILVPFIIPIDSSSTSVSRLAEQNQSIDHLDNLDGKLLLLQLSEVINRNNDLASTVADMIARNARLEEKVLGLERDRARIDGQVTSHERRVTVLARNAQRSAKGIRKEVSALKSRNKILKRLVREQKEEMTQMKVEAIDLREQLAESGQISERFRERLGDRAHKTETLASTERTLGRSQEIETGISAFSVAREFEQRGNSSRFVVITYDNVNINTGEMDPTTGEFTCRVAGIYQFFFSICVVPGGRAFVRLVKNGKWETGLYAELGEIVQSQSILLGLSVNDTVHLELGMNEDFVVGGNRFTVFHGHLLYRN